ncbi:MAG: glycosyl hydrolase family 65 protein, partial [bacterium]
RYLVDGDKVQAVSLLKGLKANHEAWEKEHFDEARGLFRWIPDRDGMEASLAGFEAGEADNFQWKTVIFGGEGYRPSLNSYMFGDMRAIAAIAVLAGDKATAELYDGKADALKARIGKDLWDREKRFFVQRRGSDGKFISGREEIGFFPWAFHVPEDKPEYAEAWRQLTDPQGFKAKYGPTTLERRSPYFLRPFKHGCLWNGPSWPYSTSLTLAALANLLNDYRQNVLTVDDYVALLRTYAVTQRDPDGKPMVREDHHPDENRWLAKGADYNHSRYCDLVITGLAGLRPRADNTLEVNPLVPAGWDYFCLDGVLYHGRAVTIFYDRTGNRYHRGVGLRILVDGVEAANSSTVKKVTIPFKSRTPPALPETMSPKQRGNKEKN